MITSISILTDTDLYNRHIFWFKTVRLYTYYSPLINIISGYQITPITKILRSAIKISKFGQNTSKTLFYAKKSTASPSQALINRAFAHIVGRSIWDCNSGRTASYVVYAWNYIDNKNKFYLKYLLKSTSELLLMIKSEITVTFSIALKVENSTLEWEKLTIRYNKATRESSEDTCGNLVHCRIDLLQVIELGEAIRVLSFDYVDDEFRYDCRVILKWGLPMLFLFVKFIINLVEKVAHRA